MEIGAVAKKEGFSRGTLYEHAKRPNPPLYMVKLADGSLRVDIDHPDFKYWLESHHNKKNYLNEDKMKLQALTKSTVEAIKELFNPDKNTLNKLLNLINEKYGAAVNEQ